MDTQERLKKTAAMADKMHGRTGQTAERTTFTLDLTPAAMQLPLDYDGNATVSNVMVRSSLFSCKGRSKSEYVQDLTLACQGGMEINYSGKRLNQSDEDIWLELKRPLGGLTDAEIGDTWIEAETKEVLKALNKDFGSTTKKWLKKKIESFRGSVFTVTEGHGEKGTTLNLLAALEWTESFHKFRYKLDKSVVALFGSDMYTVIDLKDRAKLKSDVAKFLHAYWASNKQTYPTKVETLHRLAGLTCKLPEFRRLLKGSDRITGALPELVTIGFIGGDWKIEDDKVYVKKIPK